MTVHWSDTKMVPTAGNRASFDRFAICEAHYLLACDWGLYAQIDRLERMGFKPSPLLDHDSLREDDHADAAAIYAYHNRRLHALNLSRDSRGRFVGFRPRAYSK